MFRTIAALSLLAATPAVAQTGPAFDCTKAESVAEELICSDPALSALDRRVADRYAAALETARGLDAGAEAAEDELRAYQRGWIKGRDECWKADDLRDCVETAYLRREGELVAQWLLETPTGIAFWACDGNPANEVVTYFFDTELPSVRFERGDSIDTGFVTRTASGARYEGSFGRSIWMKGENATYREPDPDGTEYTCTVARQE
ncbi:MliC family protein [Tropicimonas isoalkanivorans]|uniref:Membrane-bound lysozyme-inhibitor of c-type lysozyme n=1 Tax=Tropicimonas isoalkanivorans TaxID=441112 RepID=A0A1I1LUJ1_9RHOB|nr:MliC family protein [Tropicimonas isoalkanivorans]SFC76739.1 Membrane-bound lysozyme-inhibitor of c-type lysozyme [Tropicimonas isoalkanivorans]